VVVGHCGCDGGQIKSMNYVKIYVTPLGARLGSSWL